RTLVPTMAMFLLRPQASGGMGGHPDYVLEDHGKALRRRPHRNVFVRFQHGFEVRFSRIRDGYRGLLALALDNRRPFVIGFMVFVVASFALVPFLGENFFPAVDSGQMVIHVRGPMGTRIENTAASFDRVEDSIRGVVPADQLTTIVDNIGLPFSSINMAYANTGTVGPQDGDIYVSLNEHHRPTADYVRILRTRLPQLYPGTTFSFLPADIISQILNFGSPAPLDLQIAGPNGAANQAYANDLLRRMRGIRGIADVRIQQSQDNPQFGVNIDRTKMSEFGLTENDVTNSVVTTLSGSTQTALTFWLNRKNGVSYPISAQTPEYKVQSLSDLENIPITGTSSTAGVQVLGGLGTIHREWSAAVVSHYNIQPVIDIYATAQDRDLGGVGHDIQSLIKATSKARPKGATIALRGQVATMDTAFSGLFFGLLGAIVLVYLLIVVNYQSWLDPFVIITALPAALAGIVWMLFATGTTLSVPALTGALMCMGVATANSILVVSFARERLAATGDPLRAAIEAGVTRFRPVLMTALAMIIGMLPMALAMGEGGEQNAPLGRAVIGGLVFATIATLMFVPVVFTIVHGRKQSQESPGEPHRQAGAPTGEIYA
ncbi:MAG TPA: efflux RND transporter permease subunit, partial [Rhizomicrobium sp.]|nr:efflux RND transporter permease subunit [Rhizomicrobium sp.]